MIGIKRGIKTAYVGITTNNEIKHELFYVVLIYHKEKREVLKSLDLWAFTEIV